MKPIENCRKNLTTLAARAGFAVMKQPPIRGRTSAPDADCRREVRWGSRRASGQPRTPFAAPALPQGVSGQRV
jgi:hypothetical protein